jgi:hypothetical protein
MNEAVENVCVKENDETLRGRCAPGHLPCYDRGEGGVTPVPAFAPGDFSVRLGNVMAGQALAVGHGLKAIPLVQDGN